MAHHGSYSYEISSLDGSFNYALLSKTLASTQQEVYMQCQVMFKTTVPTQNNLILAGPGFRSAAATNLMQLGIVKDATGRKWCYRAYVGGSETNYLSASYYTVNADQWYKIKGYIYRDAAAGIIRMWVDNVLVVEQTGLNLGASDVAFARVIGFIWDVEPAARTFAFDCAQVTTDNLTADTLGMERFTLINEMNY